MSKHIRLICAACICTLILIPHTSFAQTQYDLDQQANSKFQTADKQLDKIYQSALKKADPDQRKALIASERAWIKFRDAEAEFEASPNIGGSIYPMEYSDALCDLTLARIKQLKEQMTQNM